MRIEIDHGGRTGTSDALQGASIGMDSFMARFEQMMKLQAEADAMRLARADGDRRAAAHAQNMEMNQEDLRQSREAFPIKQQAVKQEIDLRSRREARDQEDHEAFQDARKRRSDAEAMDTEQEQAAVGRALQELRALGLNPAQLKAASGLSVDRLEALVESRRMERHAKHRAVSTADYVRDLYGRGAFGPPMQGPPEEGQPLGAAEQITESMLAQLEANPYSADKIMARAEQIEQESFEIAKKREDRAMVAESLMPLIQQIDNPTLFAKANMAVKRYITGQHNDISTVMDQVTDALWLKDMDLETMDEMSQGNPAVRAAIMRERDAVAAGQQDARTAGRNIRTLLTGQQVQSASEMEPQAVTLPLGPKTPDGGFTPMKVTVPASATGRGRAIGSLRPQESAGDHASMMFWYDQATKVDKAAARDLLRDPKADPKKPETAKAVAKELMLRYGGWVQ